MTSKPTSISKSTTGAFRADGGSQASFWVAISAVSALTAITAFAKPTLVYAYRCVDSEKFALLDTYFDTIDENTGEPIQLRDRRITTVVFVQKRFCRAVGNRIRYSGPWRTVRVVRLGSYDLSYLSSGSEVLEGRAFAIFDKVETYSRVTDTSKIHQRGKRIPIAYVRPRENSAAKLRKAGFGYYRNFGQFLPQLGRFRECLPLASGIK